MGAEVEDAWLPVRRHYLRATHRNRAGAVLIAVRARASGTWQTQASLGAPAGDDRSGDAYWVFVDLGVSPNEFFVIPEWWILDDIHRHHQRYLASHGGARATNPNSDHHAIRKDRIIEWRDRWDVLGL